ncbi:MAG: hypothetical protein HUU20_28980 [Pirellulales bacterium]|nr:hypothetical protein [Pirellulales bacterium]
MRADAMAARAGWRCCRWSAYVHVHEEPEEEELAAIRRSNETGLPFGDASWVID